MNAKDALIKDILEIAKGFNEMELSGLKAYILALTDGQSPEEAFKAGEAVRTGKKNLKEIGGIPVSDEPVFTSIEAAKAFFQHLQEIGETDTPFYRQLSNFLYAVQKNSTKN